MILTLYCKGSGSSGNSYILRDDIGKILLLDLGLKKPDIMRAIDYRISDIDAAIVTHGHL
jgi:glyoxylase-like metal-dependent hydrolase (beta-lactamase superfamily II)